jgi:hypothetical protein
MRSLFTLIFITLVSGSGSVHAEPKTLVPAFAKLCGVRVGYDTMTTMERKLGPGRPIRGGHARGARVWEAPNAGCDLYADAFHWTDRKGSAGGQVLDVIFLSKHSHDAGTPNARLTREDAKFMGAASLGMTGREVRNALKEKLPPPKVRWNRLVWGAKGFAQIRPGYVMKSWQAELRFKQGKLASIELRAD